jgi:hypothetical protein
MTAISATLVWIVQNLLDERQEKLRVCGSIRLLMRLSYRKRRDVRPILRSSYTLDRLHVEPAQSVMVEIPAADVERTRGRHSRIWFSRQVHRCRIPGDVVS